MRSERTTLGLSNKYDLLVIGGGINGAGIACDAAGRGLNVLLCEADDLASATSSASSKLIHGGLRYLEQYEFRLVREALAEREVLLKKAPHLIWPLRFLLPDRSGMRPRWMIRAGLCLYDNLYRRKLIPGSRSVDLSALSAGRALKPKFTKGFAYWDCWVDDSRLVIANAQAAAFHGADILTRTQFTAAVPLDDGWQITLRDLESDTSRTSFARAIVNAAGPWVDRVNGALRMDRDAVPSNERRVRLIKGSHIVVPRIVEGDDALILQNDDGRVIFILPYEGDYSLIGTTDVEFHDAPETVSASESEVAYLLDVIAKFCRTRLEPTDIVWEFSGVRPLYNDDADEARNVTRDYRLEVTTAGNGAAALTVLGGKITTYRALAEDATSRLEDLFPGMGPKWTETASLPGGDIGATDFDTFAATLGKSYPELPGDLIRTLARRHGTSARDVLGDATTIGDLGKRIGHSLYEREALYLKQHEWAKQPNDILWRRTKVGLHLDAEGLATAERSLEAIL